MKIKIEEILNKELKKSIKANEVPVAAIIVKNNKIISRAHNTKQRKHNILNHAEIIAISKAEKKLHDWRLNNCDLYVTLEPCNMCKEVINHSRIKNVYYYNKTTFENIKCYTNYKEIDNKSSQKYLSEIRNYFHKKR